MSTTPIQQRVFGAEYGPEAIRQLTDGSSIVYAKDGLLIEERPNGQRFAIRSEADARSASIETKTGDSREPAEKPAQLLRDAKSRNVFAS